jgi:hypothetical protein
MAINNNGAWLMKPEDTYLVFSDPSSLFDQSQVPQLPLAPPSMLSEALPGNKKSNSATALSGTPTEQGVRRQVDVEWDHGQYRGKRCRKNKPEGLTHELWAAGVSADKQEGWQLLRFTYAPKEAWKTTQVYVHATATVGDVKYFLAPQTGMAHSEFCVFGSTSQLKLPFTEEITAFSKANGEPLEDRVLVPLCRRV